MTHDETPESMSKAPGAFGKMTIEDRIASLHRHGHFGRETEMSDNAKNNKSGSLMDSPPSNNECCTWHTIGVFVCPHCRHNDDDWVSELFNGLRAKSEYYHKVCPCCNNPYYIKFNVKFTTTLSEEQLNGR